MGLSSPVTLKEHYNPCFPMWSACTIWTNWFLEKFPRPQNCTRRKWAEKASVAKGYNEEPSRGQRYIRKQNGPSLIPIPFQILPFSLGLWVVALWVGRSKTSLQTSVSVWVVDFGLQVSENPNASGFKLYGQFILYMTRRVTEDTDFFHLFYFVIFKCCVTKWLQKLQTSPSLTDSD